MANWCYQDMCFYSKNKEELERFFDKISNIIEGKEMKEENGFGDGWLGNILINHGLDKELVMSSNNVGMRYRGVINWTDDEIYFNDEHYYFYLQEETAWYPMTKMWDYILKQYKDIKYCMLAEEPGDNVFINTDRSEKFFDTKYMIDINIEKGSIENIDGNIDEDIDTEYNQQYFREFKEVKNFILKTTGHKVKSLEHAKLIGEKIAEIHEDSFMYVHKYSPNYDKE